MKINEILEFAPPVGEPAEMSPYTQRMKDTLVDYLSSLNATGAQKDIPTQMMVNFLKRQSYDVTPEQIDQLLADTPFAGDSEKINVAGEPQGVMKGRDPEFNKKKVKSMANQKIKKDI